MEATPKRRPVEDLTGKQRRHLRGLAHHLDPVVVVGKDGVTPALLRQLQDQLVAHELIKVRVLETAPTSRDDAAEALCAAAGAHRVGAAGRVVVLYRQHGKTPRVELPA